MEWGRMQKGYEAAATHMESDSRFKWHGAGEEHRSLDNLSKVCRRRQLLCQCDVTNPNKGLVEARGVEGIAISRRIDL